eukprot:5252358-Amphidinium_carterae.1
MCMLMSRHFNSVTWHHITPEHVTKPHDRFKPTDIANTLINSQVCEIPGGSFCCGCNASSMHLSAPKEDSNVTCLGEWSSQRCTAVH